MRTIKKSLIAALILSASFGGSALAGGGNHDHAEEEKQGFYLTAGTGLNRNQDVDYTTTIGEESYSGDIEFDSNIAFDFGIGYDFGKLRAEVAYQNTPADLTTINAQNVDGNLGVTATAAADIEMTSFFANLYYDLPEYQLGEKTLVPYLGAGIGQSTIDIGTVRVDGVEIMNGDDSTFAYQLKLGTTYEMNEKADLYVEGVFNETSDWSIASTQGFTMNLDPVKSLGARAGLRFKF